MEPSNGSPTPKPENFFFSMMKDWGAAIVIVLLGYAMYSTFIAPKAPALGPAADFILADGNGQSVQLSKLEAETIVVNFWFINCPPCRREIPELAAFAKANPDIPLYGINTDPVPTKKVKDWSDRNGLDYHLLHDMKGEAARAYDVSVFPTTLVIQDGNIVASKIGELDQATLQQMVNRVH